MQLGNGRGYNRMNPIDNYRTHLMVDACRTIDMATRLETIEVRGGTAEADRTEEGRGKGREGGVLNDGRIIIE